MGRWNPTAAVAGLLFVVLGVLYLLDDLDVVNVRGVVVIPLLLIGLGLAILAGGSRREA